MTLSGRLASNRLWTRAEEDSYHQRGRAGGLSIRSRHLTRRQMCAEADNTLQLCLQVTLTVKHRVPESHILPDQPYHPA